MKYIYQLKHSISMKYIYMYQLKHIQYHFFFTFFFLNQIFPNQVRIQMNFFLLHGDRNERFVSRVS